MHPTFMLTHGPFAWDTTKKPASSSSHLFKLPALGKTVKITENSSFMLKELLIPVSSPDFLVKHLFLYSLCPLTRFFKSLKPLERKQTFTDTSCWPFWAHQSGPQLRACLFCLLGEGKIWAALPLHRTPASGRFINRTARCPAFSSGWALAGPRVIHLKVTAAVPSSL